MSKSTMATDTSSMQQQKNATRILDQMVVNVTRAESTKKNAIKNAAEDLKRIGTPLNMISQMIKKRAKDMDVTEDYIGRCLPPELKDQAQRQVALAKYHDGRTQGLPKGTTEKKDIKVTKRQDIKFLRQEVKVLRRENEDLKRLTTQQQLEQGQQQQEQQPEQQQTEQAVVATPRQSLPPAERDNIDLKNKIVQLAESTENSIKPFHRLIYQLEKEPAASDKDIADRVREIIRFDELDKIKKTRQAAQSLITGQVEAFHTYDIDKYDAPLLREWILKLNEKLEAARNDTSNNYQLGQYVMMIHQMMVEDKKLQDMIVDKIDKEVKRQEAKGYMQPSDDSKRTSLQHLAENVILNKKLGPTLNKILGGSDRKDSDRNYILRSLEIAIGTAFTGAQRRRSESKTSEAKAKAKAKTPAEVSK